MSTNRYQAYTHLLAVRTVSRSACAVPCEQNTRNEQAIPGGERAFTEAAGGSALHPEQGVWFQTAVTCGVAKYNQIHNHDTLGW